MMMAMRNNRMIRARVMKMKVVLLNCGNMKIVLADDDGDNVLLLLILFVDVAGPAPVRIFAGVDADIDIDMSKIDELLL